MSFAVVSTLLNWPSKVRSAAGLCCWAAGAACGAGACAAAPNDHTLSVITSTNAPTEVRIRNTFITNLHLDLFYGSRFTGKNRSIGAILLLLWYSTRRFDRIWTIASVIG